MSSVIRAACIYAFLLIIFRFAGKRTLAQITTFDLVLTLIISEAIQQALVDSDNSLTNAILLVITLVGLDLGLSVLKGRSDRIDRIVEGMPVIILENGTLHQARMNEERVSEAEILGAAREAHGLARMEQIRYAVVEQNGRITIVPQER